MKKWNQKGKFEKDILMYVLSLGFAMMELQFYFLNQGIDGNSDKGVKDTEKIFNNPNNSWKNIGCEKMELKEIDVDDLKNLMERLNDFVREIKDALESTLRNNSKNQDFIIENLLLNQKRLSKLIGLLKTSS